MINIDYAENTNSVFLYDRLNNKPIHITSDRLNYKSIIEAIRNDDEDLVRSLLDENQILNNISNGRVTVKGSSVFLDGKELHSAEAKKLVDLVSEGATNIDRWFRFIEKLHDNPSYHCRKQAYDFIAHTGMPMTENGNLIGYKGVQDDYYSQHGNTNNRIIQGIVNNNGQILNTVGSTIEMPRSDVDDNPNNGCSSGLHVGSHDYANSWAGADGRLMIVEYNPADIVSVPAEHGSGKLRVCKYTIIAEHTSRSVLNDGAYGNTNNINYGDLFNYLDDHVHHSKVYYNDVKSRFPNVTMQDIKECIEDYSEYHLDCTFDSYSNDYTIEFQSLPS